MKNGHPLREFGSFFPLCVAIPSHLYSIEICCCSKEFGSFFLCASCGRTASWSAPTTTTPTAACTAETS